MTPGIRLDLQTLDYFKKLSEELGMPCQTLINHYLQDCAASGKRLLMKWVAGARAQA